MNKLLIIVVLQLCCLSISAQTKANQKPLSWWNFSGNYNVSENISLSTLYSWRRTEFIKTWQQSLLRVGVNYKVKKNFIVTPGYDWVMTYPYGEQPIAKKTTEHRFFEQFTLKNSICKVKINHRYRFEQRFFNRFTDFYNRFRYKLSALKTITKNEKIALSIFNEVFLNYGKQAKTHLFDQNWLYFGLNFSLNNSTTLKVGYMNQYVLKRDNLHVENNHTIQFGLQLKDLNKNKKALSN